MKLTSPATRRHCMILGSQGQLQNCQYFALLSGESIGMRDLD